tara:strand:- start:486 stop:1352 length:867 start_codon:yes stop_codon:yes gene_type:complete
MPFIGTQPEVGGYSVLDALTASATASYTLQKDSANFTPSSANQLLVSLNGVIQKPGSSFTVSGSTLTFSSALTSSDSIDFILAMGEPLLVGTPSDGAVNTTQLATNAVSSAKIASSAVTDAKIAGMAATKLTGTVSNARFPTGSIIQVQENTRTATFNVAANSNYTDMGLGVVITPTSTSSKILVTLSINGYYGKLGNVAGYIHTRIARVIGGSASACTGTNTNIDTEIGRNNSQGDHRNIVMTILDEPSTTSEITYRAEYRTATGSSGVMYNDTSATSTAIAMEIVG